MALWKQSLDPFVSILEPVSSRILVLVLDMPGYQVSIHVTIYLSTSGRDPEFIEDLSLLENTIDELGERYPDALIYVRGDANASIPTRPGNKRDDLFQHFCSENDLLNTPVGHHTYHHFVNNGLSDSSIDVLLSPGQTTDGFPHNSPELLSRILCGKTSSIVDSHHDAILSSVTFPKLLSSSDQNSENVKAPRVINSRHKTIWSEEGIEDYKSMLSEALPALQSDYSSG